VSAQSVPAGPRPAPRNPREINELLERLARVHGPALEGYALRLCGCPDDARDLVQDAFERALRAFDGRPPHSNERAWLFTILYHLFVDRRRQRLRAPEPLSLEGIEVAHSEPPPLPAWHELGVEQVRAAMSELPDELRAAYQLLIVEQKSYQEIATALGVPVSTVGTRILRARRRLRTLLTERGGDHA
jgi:RNA polymerase sigma-70 factor (ECF subfamily)